jgi:hypothetical protein
MLSPWLGLTLFIIGAWLSWRGLAQRRRVLAWRHEHLAANQPEDNPTPHSNPQLAMLGDIFRPIIIFALVFVGAKTTLAYYLLGGAGMFSLFDLAGFLFLLTGYGIWIIMKTKYREIGLVTTNLPQPQTQTITAAEPLHDSAAAGSRPG